MDVHRDECEHHLNQKRAEVMRILEPIKLGCFVLIACVTLVAPECYGQSRSSLDDMEAGTPSETETWVADKTPLDLHFSKPTALSEVIDEIRAQNEINIVLAPDLNQVLVAPIQLKNISLSAVLSSLSIATGGEVEWKLAGSNEDVVWISRNPQFVNKKHKQPEVTVHVINASRILANQQISEASLLSALEIGLEMNNSSPDSVNLKLHKETKLLFMRASENDAGIVFEIVDRLEEMNGRDPFGG